MNDNITKTFLTDMCKRFGEIEDCKIYYDRQTKKHLGLGTVRWEFDFSLWKFSFLFSLR